MNDLYKKTISFIGAGNMASALISGLISNGYPAKHIWASNPTTPKLNLLQEKFGIYTTTVNSEAASIADIVVLSIKPLEFPKVCAEIRNDLKKDQQFIVSVGVGTTISL